MLDDVGHVPVFAGLAAIVFTFAFGARPPLQRAALTAAVCMAIGVTVEIVQLVTSTGLFQVKDLWFDLLGIAIGLSVAAIALLALPRWVVAIVVVVGLSISLALVPADDGIPDFSYATRAVEARCRDTGALPPTETSGPPPAPLVSYDFAEAEGSVVRDTAGQLDLSIDSEDTVVRADQGLEFDGQPALVRSIGTTAAVTTAVENRDEVSIAVSFTPSVLPQRGPVRIVTISEGTDFGETNVHIGIEGRAISFRVRTDCDFFNWTLTDDVLVEGRRAHVVASYRPGLATIHLDGEIVASVPTEFGLLDPWEPTRHLFVGDEATSDRAFTGTVHEMALYDVALSGTQVATIVG